MVDQPGASSLSVLTRGLATGCLEVSGRSGGRNRFSRHIVVPHRVDCWPIFVSGGSSSIESCPVQPLLRPRPGYILDGMKTAEGETRRALSRLRRALEKARREIRALQQLLERSEAEGFPGDDYAEMDEHLGAVTDLVNREQARQQSKILRSGGIGPGRLRGSSGGADRRPGMWGDDS